MDYPFAERLYPGALDVIAHLRRWGETVILSDGDVVFQPHKGHYALDPRNSAAYPPADIPIERIGGLINVDFPALPGTPKAGCTL